MTKTQFLDARRNIRRELVAYLSIIIIGMLATLSYLGITYSAATLKTDALRFFDAYNLWDLEIASTMMLDDADLEAIRALPGVETAERVWQTDAKLRIGGRDTAVTVISLPEAVSLPKLLEGRLPETAGECAVEKALADQCGLSVGQRMDLENQTVSDIDPLPEKSLVITGVFYAPDHISYMVPVTPYVLVTADSFDRDGLDGAFMKLRVRVEGAAEDRYSDAYWQAVSPVEDAIGAIAEDRAAQRRDRMRQSIDSRLDEGREKLAEAEAQLDDGRRQLDDGRKTLGDKQAELEDGRAKLRDGRQQLEDGRAKLAEVRGQLDEGWGALHEAEEQLSEAKEQLDWGGDALTEAEYLIASIPGYLVRAAALLDELEEEEGISLLPGLRQQYKDGLHQYHEGRLLWYSKGEEYLDAVTLFEKNKKQLEEGEREYADALVQLADSEKQIEDGEEQLREGESALGDAQQQLADAEARLSDGERQYRDAQKQLRDLEEIRDKLEIGRWIVLNNKGNPGYIYAEANSDKLSSLSMSFSSIFLVVGALVIYATIGRMVEQQRGLIGATKALGLYNREVFAKYLFFACSAALLGVGLGVLIAWLPLQRTILSSYEKLLNYGIGTRSFLKRESGLVVAGAFAISVAAVYLGCAHLLRLPAIQLMQNAMPESKRKKAGRSAKKSLYFRLIFRNMRTDWSRVMVTTVSIAGGCMLMVIGFTLRYGISGVPDRQFGGILTYGAEVFYDASENPDAAAEIGAVLDANALPSIRLRKADGVFEADGTLNALTMIVAEQGALEGYFALKDVKTGGPLALPESGALVPRRFSEYYGLGVGDDVTVYDSGMNLNEIRIAGVFENYYGQLFFLTPESYEEVYLSAPEQNCFFVKTDGMSLDALRQALAEVPGVTKVNDAAADRNVIEQFTASLNFVVWLMLFIAAMMACFIVANFTVTYIQRKTRELTIMRINGFSARECVRYAAVDLVITTILGTLLGLVLGGFVGQAVLRTTETPYIQMIRDPAVQAYLYSALITFGFSAVTNSYALRRIKTLKLSDIT